MIISLQNWYHFIIDIIYITISVHITIFWVFVFFGGFLYFIYGTSLEYLGPTLASGMHVVKCQRGVSCREAMANCGTINGNLFRKIGLRHRGYDTGWACG